MEALSSRGRRLLSGFADYIGEHMARAPNEYHPLENSSGYIGLCIAENAQMWDLLEPHVSAGHRLPAGVARYGDMSGSELFRRRVAGLLGRTVFGRPVDPSSVVTMAGAGAILEAVFAAIADPGEAVLVPTPSYAGFWPDLEQRDGLRIVPVDTSPDDEFRLHRHLLDTALEGSASPVRALLFTNPDNPLGRVATADDLQLVVDWCAERGIHLVVDEIYALSVFGAVEFQSVGRRVLGDSVHVVWAFSKDLAMSGMRVGVLVTENPEVRQAVAAQSVWGSVSGLTQAVLGDMIADEGWTDHYLSEVRRRLGAMHDRLGEALRSAGIPHLRSDAGFFLLLDLRGYLDAPTWQSEARLWRRLLEEANLNLTPGSACRISEPGFFRLCFASVPIDTALEGVRRLSTALSSVRS